MMKSTPQEHLFQFKKQVVQWAQIHGVKPAVRKWGLGRNTIRRRQKRFKEAGNKGLYDRRKGPNRIPHKTPLLIEEQVVSAREQVPCYGARRLKYFFGPKPGARSHLKNHLNIMYLVRYNRVYGNRD